MTDFALIGRKLREARTSLLFEAREAAAEIRVSEEEYRQIEEGILHVTGDQLVLLAHLYRRDFRHFVTGDYPSAESQIRELFRQNGALSKADRIAIQEFSILCECEHFLEGILGVTHSTLPQYKIRRTSHRKTQGVIAAAQERRRLGLGTAPIHDVFSLVRQGGIHLFRRHLTDANISGIYLRHPTAGHCILINYKEDLYRQGFSTAHEYAHSLFDSSTVEQCITYENRTQTPEEWRANAFAGRFLVPPEALRSFSGQMTEEQLVSEIKATASRFRVNGVVVLIGLGDLGVLGQERVDRLRADKRIVIKHEDKYDSEIPPSLSPGIRGRLTVVTRNGLSWYFLQLCRRAYDEGIITFGRAVEMTGLPRDDALRLFDDLDFRLEAHRP